MGRSTIFWVGVAYSSHCVTGSAHSSGNVRFGKKLIYLSGHSKKHCMIAGVSGCLIAIPHCHRLGRTVDTKALECTRKLDGLTRRALQHGQQLTSLAVSASPGQYPPVPRFDFPLPPGLLPPQYRCLQSHPRQWASTHDDRSKYNRRHPRNYPWNQRGLRLPLAWRRAVPCGPGGKTWRPETQPDLSFAASGRYLGVPLWWPSRDHLSGATAILW